jgi:hypothetical protein
MYLKWAEETGYHDNLPDLVLDMHQKNPNKSWVTYAADGIAITAVLLCVTCCAYKRNLLILNTFCVAQCLYYILNIVAENVTIIPSSYGYERCIEYLDIHNSHDLTHSMHWTGSCAAMMWSGHTAQTIIATYFACRAFDAVLLRATCFAAVAGACEMALLLADSGHYTVDCYMSFLITFPVITHPALLVIAHRANPFAVLYHEERVGMLSSNSQLSANEESHVDSTTKKKWDAAV